MRLFIGIDLPHDIKQNLLAFQGELKESGVRGFWKAKDNFHLTLEFLGEIQPQSLSLITEGLTAAAMKQRPFTLSLGGLGGFPNLKRPHTLWTAVNGNIKELTRLRDDIHSRLSANGFRLEERPFKPHLTLASRPLLDGVDLTNMQNKMLGSFEVKQVILFESSVIQGKRTYTPLFTQSFLAE